MLRTGIDNNSAQQWNMRYNPAANPKTTQGITPEAPSVSAAPPSQQAASPEQVHLDDRKPGV